jgi:hypothetical protein
MKNKKSKKQKNNRSETYEPLVSTNLSFSKMLKLAAHTPLPKDEKIAGSRSNKKSK